jgi:hypothetical protein
LTGIFSYFPDHKDLFKGFWSVPSTFKMAEQFVGLTMLVTLSSPPDAQLRGKVSSVVAGKSLTLRDGMSFLQAHLLKFLSCSAIL